jgi:hypothetical protein
MLTPKSQKQESDAVRRRKQVDEKLADDFRAGLSDSELIGKYHLSRKKLKARLARLVDTGLLSQAELDARKEAEEAAKREMLAESLKSFSEELEPSHDITRDSPDSDEHTDAAVSAEPAQETTEATYVPTDETSYDSPGSVDHARDDIFFEERHWYGLEALLSAAFGLVPAGLFYWRDSLSPSTDVGVWLMMGVDAYPYLAAGFLGLAVYQMFLRCDIVQIRSDGIYYRRCPWHGEARKKVDWDSVVDFSVQPGRRGFLAAVWHLLFVRRHERKHADAEVIIMFRRKDGAAFSLGTNHAVDFARAVDRAKKSRKSQ